MPSGAQLVAEAGLGRAKVAYALADAETGEILEARSPLLPQPPASVAKAVTALYALDALGPAHRFATRLMATGPVADGVLEGDLILAGTGDPTLQTNALAELAARLKAAGVQSVRGAFRIWAGALPRIDRIDPGQPDHVGYNPAVAGLNLNFNRVHFEWRRSGADYDVSMDARSDRYRPAVSVAQIEVVARAGPVYTYEDGGDVDLWTVARGALGGGGSRWLPVREPALYAAEVFATFARSQGIALDAPEPLAGLPDGAVPLAQVESETLRPLLADMLDFSTNVTAEAVGLAASAARGPVPADLAASAAAMSDWLGAALVGRRPDFVDHSGLGDMSRISARDMVGALVRLGPDARLEGILEEIPVRDAAYRVVPDYPATVAAKTGTLNFVSGLAGYIRPWGGRRFAFAIFAADMDRRAAIPRARRDNADGAAPWARRARLLQHRLIDRWAIVHGGIPPEGLRMRPRPRPEDVAARAAPLSQTVR
jgi:D-alanyl-D-alanine carboxypeptidase/D-alanyl-D-alanine-endopeptidase (penicillin-binding protein 4)